MKHTLQQLGVREFKAIECGFAQRHSRVQHVQGGWRLWCSNLHIILIDILTLLYIKNNDKILKNCVDFDGKKTFSLTPPIRKS